MFDSKANLIRSPVWKSRAGSTSMAWPFGPSSFIRNRRPGATAAAALVEVESNISFALTLRGTAVDTTGAGVVDPASSFTATGFTGTDTAAVRSGAVAGFAAGDAAFDAAAFDNVAPAGCAITGGAGTGATVATAEGSAFVDGKPSETTASKTAAAAAPPTHTKRFLFSDPEGVFPPAEGCRTPISVGIESAAVAADEGINLVAPAASSESIELRRAR